jgi:hypothetical protein
MGYMELELHISTLITEFDNHAILSTVGAELRYLVPACSAAAL